MALTTPVAATLSLDNLVLTGGAITATSEATGYPASRLLDQLRSRRWRSTGVALQTLLQQFLASYQPTVLGLADCNITTTGADLAATKAKAAIWLDTSLETGADGSQVYSLADRSGNDRDFVIGSAFLSAANQATITQHHKADAIPVQGDSSALASWLDSASGATPSATSSGSNQPTYRIAANGKNGLPIIEFDGIDDYLTWGADVSFGTAHTLVFVVRIDSFAAARAIVGDVDQFDTITITSSVIQYTTQTDIVQVSGLSIATGWHILAIQRSGNSVNFTLDGAQQGTTQTMLNNGVFAPRYIGRDAGTGGSFLLGAFAELIYSTSVADLFLIEAVAAMARKWAITITPKVTLETNEQDSKPVARFDATLGFAGYGDQLSLNNAATTGFSLGTSHSLFFLFKLSTLNAANVFAGNGTAFVNYNHTATQFEYRTDAGGSNVNVDQTLTAGTWYILAVIRSGASVSFYLNGTQVGTTQTLTGGAESAVFTIKTVGAELYTGVNHITGDLAEVFIATSALTTAERIALQDYLAAKWVTTTVYGSLILEYADNSGMTTNRVGWVLQTYTQGDPGCLTWYLGTPDFGTAGTRAYWRLTIPPSATTDAYYQIGKVWLGTYRSLYISPVDNEVVDPSNRSFSAGGAPYIDTLGRYEEIPVDVDLLTFSEARDLKEALRAHGPKHLLYDQCASLSDQQVKAASTYYGILDDRRGVRWQKTSPQDNSISFSVRESAV